MADDEAPPPKPDWFKKVDPYIRATNAHPDLPIYALPPPYPPTSTLAIGAAWSTHFTNRLKRRLYYGLRYAYRAPSFFVGRMAKPGASHPVGFVSFDDDLTVDQLDGTTGRLQEDADIVYFCTHGKYSHGLYSAHLHAKDWLPTQTGLGQNRPAVIVFDTCDLVDLKDPNWPNQWKRSTVGPALRLVLGFAGQGDGGKLPTRRGGDFATEMLAGKSIAEAWLSAAHNTSVFHESFDYAIAIAFGDDAKDAQDVLNHASLSNWPNPRTGSHTEIVWRLCH